MKRFTDFLLEEKKTILWLLILLFLMCLLKLENPYSIPCMFILAGLIIGVQSIQPDDQDEWRPISETPPNELLDVLDEQGRMRQACPTYYPFKSSPTIKNKKLGISVEKCEPYWDGGWIFELGDDMKKTPAFDLPEFGKVVKWRKMKKEDGI